MRGGIMHTHTHTLTGKSLMTERMNTNSHFKSSFNTSFAQLLKKNVSMGNICEERTKGGWGRGKEEGMKGD